MTTRRAWFAFAMAVGGIAVGAAVGVGYGNLSLREAAYLLVAAAVGAGAVVALIKKLQS